MLDGTVPQATFIEADEDFRSEIAIIEQELQESAFQQGTQEAFVRFAKLHLIDLSNAWQLAGPEQRQRVQSLLFSGGLAYAPDAGFLNRSKSSLYTVLQAMKDEKDLLASPTGFEPVLPP